MQQATYDKFLFTCAVSKRAKSILEEGVVYEPVGSRIDHPILEAIKEINDGLIDVHILDSRALDVKEDDDTLDSLYENIKITDQDVDIRQKASDIDDVVLAIEVAVDSLDAELLSVSDKVDDDEEDDEDEDDEDDIFVDDELEVLAVGVDLEGDLAAGGMHTEDAEASAPPDII